MNSQRMNRGQTSWKHASFVLVGVLILASLILFINRSPITGNVVNAGTTNTLPSPTAKALIDDDPVYGDPKATVTIVEFTDAQCPFCRKGEAIVSQVMQDYAGKVKLVTRDFPLESLHPAAMPSALALDCVREQGGDAGYYAFKALILAHQNERDGGKADSPVTTTIAFTNADLVTWAGELNYDIKTCLETEKYKAEVQKDMADGQAAGVQGTPAFFLIAPDGTSTFISGAQPYSVFKNAIDAVLK